jgi:four helix bundle suffix protein
LEELRLDYEDFLRQRRLTLWAKDDARRKELVARRCRSADEVAEWVKEVAERGVDGRNGRNGRDGRKAARSISSRSSIKSMKWRYAEVAANAMLVLIGVTVSLLDRQIAAQAKAFEREGGFTERLYRVRQDRRRSS